MNEMRTAHNRLVRRFIPAGVVLAMIVAGAVALALGPRGSVFGAGVTRLAVKAAAKTIGWGGIRGLVFDAPITIDASPVDGTPLAQGQVITYTVTVTNDGNNDETFDNNRLRVKDAIPANTTYVSSSLKILQQPGGGSSPWTCDYKSTDNRIECLTPEAGVLRATAVFKFEFQVKINDGAQYGTVITNIAEFYNEQQSGQNTVTNTSNQTSHPVTLPADLAVSKQSSAVVDPDGAGPLPTVTLPVVGVNVPAGSVNSGGYIRYDIPFGNSGPANADNTMFTDRIPANTEYLGALETGGSFIAAGTSTTFTVKAVDGVAPTGPDISLSCTVVGAAGNQTIYCRPQGNLGLTPSYLDGTLPWGYAGTLTLFVRVNESVTGGQVVSNPASIASGLCPNSGSSLFPPVSCVGTPDANPANNKTPATQNLIVASSNLSVTKVVQYAVTAASSPNETGPIAPATPANGVATTGAAVIAGTYLTYRVTLTNNGPSDVAGIRLTELLPSFNNDPLNRVLGAKFISVSPVVPSGATLVCAPPVGVNTEKNPQGNGGTVVCTAPLLSANAPNNTASIDLTVFVDPATRDSLISTSTFDATINNFNRPVAGTATLTTPVTAISDLALIKTHVNDLGVDGGSVTAGKSFSYLLSVTNNGPSTARGYQLIDTLPSFQKVTKIETGMIDGNGLFVTPNIVDGNQNPAVGCTQVDAGDWTTTVTCTATELPSATKPDGISNPAGRFVVRLTVSQDQRTPQPVPISYQNCATATSTSSDPNDTDNVGICDTVGVEFSSDVKGTLTVSPNPAIAGETLTYTIVAVSDGPSAAYNMQIRDVLPSGTIFVSASASAGASLTTPSVGTNGMVTAIWDGSGGTDSVPGGTADGLTTVGTTRTLTIVARICSDVQQTLGLTDTQMCKPNLVNEALVSSDTLDPSMTGNSLSVTSTVQTRSNLQLLMSGPTEVPFSTSVATSYITYTLSFQNNGSSNSNGTKIVNVLPRSIKLETWNSTVPGTTMSLSTAAGVQTLTFTLGVLSPVAGNPAGAIQCSNSFPSSGTITIKAKVEIAYPVIDVINTATISLTNCLADPDLTNNTATLTTAITLPGLTDAASYPATAEAGGQQAGSILFYPIYTSDAVTAARQDTKISMTNVSPAESVTMHIFAVDGASCAVLDYFICLTPNQTWTYRASDFDPGNSGYIMAVAVDYATGLPRAFNNMIGDSYVKLATGQSANLPALSIQSLTVAPAGFDTSPVAVDLRFDGIAYNRLPQTVAIDSIASVDNRNSTLLILDRIGGDLTASGATIGNISGILFDDQEIAYSFTRGIGACQLREVFSNNFPRTFTPFTKIIPSGRAGWIKIWATGSETKALFGAVINYNPTTASNSTSYGQGHNLHTLTVTQSPVIVRIPLIQPTCN